MATIDASQLVAVVPSVQGAGGTAVDVIGLVLTNGTRVPLGQVLSFPSAAAVASYFGAASHEAQIAGGGVGLGSGYFGGFTGASKIPSNILFAQYNTVDVGAYLRGGSVAALTLTQLQAINGTLAVIIDGVSHSGTINLSAATSFSNAATIIADTLDIEGAQAAAFTAAISTTTMTVSAVSSGTLAVGQIVKGSGVAADTYITALGSGTGGTGTYTVNNSQSVGSESMTTDAPGVTYDSTSGGFVIASNTTGASSTLAYATGATSAALKLTSATGAVLSQGALAAVPATFMNALIAVNRNWVCFGTAFDPDGGSGNTVKQAFAAWKNTQNKRFAYVCWDTDITPTQSVPATASLGYILANNGDEGTCLVYEATDLNLMPFVMGAAAAIDFTARGGRISFAYRQQAGLVASVTDPTVAANLAGNPQTSDHGNGYNFYGAYANANQNFTTFQRGFVTGTFSWFDSYVCQVWFNSLCQSALLNFLTSANSIPYDDAGRALIEAALADPIQQAKNFGLFGAGPLSSAQIAEVNGAAGANISDTLQTQGYFLQVLPSTASVRAARTSPPCKLWYIDSGAVQAITLASISLQQQKGQTTMGDISAANATIIFTVPVLFGVPVQVQGFGPDDVFSLDDIELVETSMGVDGRLSGGFVWKEQMMGMTLQADSPSNDFLDTWMQNQQAGLKVYPCNGVIALPSIGKKLIGTTGFFSTYKLPDAKRSLTARRYRFKWQQLTAFPL